MFKFENVLLKSEKFIKRNKGLITTIGACVGVAATIYFTAKSTLKIEETLREVHTPEECKGVKKIVIKHCAKPAISAALTIFCIVLTYKFGKAAEAGLLTLVAGGYETLKQYREGVNDSGKLSPEEEQKIFEEAITAPSKPLPEKENYDDFILYKESLTGEYFYARPSDINVAEIKLNRNINIGEYESFWFFLQCLTENDTFKDYKEGAIRCGWCSKGWGSEEKYGYCYADICQKKMTDENGREYVLIYYPFLPHTDYEDPDLIDDREFTVTRVLKSR